MGARADVGPEWPTTEPGVGAAAPLVRAAPDAGPARPNVSPRWVPWIFAAKTTASGVLALFIAFAFNIDQPKWALRTVFILGQPLSGLVPAKSFDRIMRHLSSVLTAAGDRMCNAQRSRILAIEDNLASGYETSSGQAIRADSENGRGAGSVIRMRPALAAGRSDFMALEPSRRSAK